MQLQQLLPDPCQIPAPAQYDSFTLRNHVNAYILLQRSGSMVISYVEPQMWHE